MTHRLIQLFWGLALYGLSIGLMVRSGLGLHPWDVFHQGLSQLIGLSLGGIIVVVGVVVLLFWIPLRQRPGIGTIANVFMIGFWADVSLWLIPPTGSMAIAWAMLSGGIFLNGVAGGAYIGAGLGAGPRDGLMTGLVNRTGYSVSAIRTGIELTVVAAGWTLGGTLGLGTLLYAVAIGPIVHWMLPLLTIREEQGELPGSRNALSECPDHREAA